MQNILLYLCCLISLYSIAQNTSTLQTKHFNSNKNIAIGGYDLVAYFTQNKAIEGNKKYTVSDQGIIYYFSLENNKRLFLKTPSNYEPQYGGWCAYAMGAKGTKVEIDPETFKIKDGKLFLFYHKLFTNTLLSWNKDEDNLNREADKNWKSIISK